MQQPKDGLRVRCRLLEIVCLLVYHSNADLSDNLSADPTGSHYQELQEDKEVHVDDKLLADPALHAQHIPAYSTFPLQYHVSVFLSHTLTAIRHIHQSINQSSTHPHQFICPLITFVRSFPACASAGL